MNTFIELDPPNQLPNQFWYVAVANRGSQYLHEDDMEVHPSTNKGCVSNYLNNNYDLWEGAWLTEVEAWEVRHRYYEKHGLGAFDSLYWAWCGQQPTLEPTAKQIKSEPLFE